MSTTPQGWQTPKTNWQAADIVHPSDFNRIEGNIQAIESGSRTLDPSQVPSGNSGSLRQILSWFANRIRAITGATNWYDAPPMTLAGAKSHAENTNNPHGVTAEQLGATSAATANRIIIRDSAGRAKVAAPSASDDIARKAEVDAVSSALNTHKDATSGIHGATSSATANRIIIRDSAGRAKFAAPSESDDAATKGYVDALFGTPMAAGTNFVVQLVGPSGVRSGVDTYPDWQESIRNASDRSNNVAVRIWLPGTVRCALEHCVTGDNFRSYARVLKNGSVVQEWSTTSTTFVSRSVDVDVSPGDVITFQQRSNIFSSFTYGSIWNNLRVMTAAPTLGIQRIL